MKRKDLAGIALLGLLLWGALPLIAEETAGEKATSEVLASSGVEKSSVAADADRDAFREDHLYPARKKSDPVATVSGAEKKEVVTSSVKTKTIKAVAPTSKGTPKAASIKKPVEAKKKTETVHAADSAEMEKRWKAIFSKELTKESASYTVKPGDSFYVIARKNHTTVDLLKKINGFKSDNLYVGTKLKIYTAPFSILVDKSKNTLTLYSDGLPVKKYSVATGKKNSTPTGTFEIKDKLLNPTWFKTGAILPPGSPENGLGTRWMGFDKPSYGIHGTIDPKSIGAQASEGCVRMLNEDVEELYSLVPTGTKVTIQD